MCRTTVQSALRDSFARRPEAIAVEQGDLRITYRSLDQRAAGIAKELVKKGVTAGSVVAVLAKDRSLLIAAMLGILDVRGIFVLLDPAHPLPYLAAQLETVQPTILLADSGSDDLFASDPYVRSVRTIRLDEMSVDGPRVELTAECLDYSPDDPVYIYFTSGTTGIPKPILGRNGSLLHFVQWEIAEFDLPETVRVSQLTSPSHDPFLRDVLMTLVAGGTVCIPPDRNVVLSAAELRSWLTSEAVNLVHCTPTIFRNLCSGKLESTDFPRLRWMLVAGERLRGLDVARWFGQFGDRIELVNLYGPTETTLAKFFHRVAAEDAEIDVVPIGRPIADTDYWIRNLSRDCEIGEIGELFILTNHGALGYYQSRPDADDGFSVGPADVRLVYRTGDYVRQRSDGNVEFVGRRDRQVKIAGERVELEDIETKISRVPGVRDCYVHFDGTAGETERLVAYLVDGDGFEIEKVRSQVSSLLPPAQVPSHFVRVAALPTKVNGKLDPAQLPGAFSNGSQEEHGVQTNGGPHDLPRVLTDIWKDILGREEIGQNDAFMENGGDSLKIMLLIGQLDERFGYELSLWDVFDDLTIERLAQKITEAGETAT